ncbi:MAG: hydroxylamine reductase [Sporomusaceae bacterium]|nr:hydroxylamine reductase [Sporomusaceae bacterium]
MFCYQCEQTAQGKGCESFGVCGKNPETAGLQDVLLYGAQAIAVYAHAARKLGVVDHEIDLFVVHALFTTVTNVNFDPLRLQGLLQEAYRLKEKAKALYEDACAKAGVNQDKLAAAANFTYDSTLAGDTVAYIADRTKNFGADVSGLMEMIFSGLKGVAAYADHAQVLGQEDETVYGFFHEALSFLAKDIFTVDELVAMAFKVGEVNLTVMALLDAANTGAYGDPVPTAVRVTPVKGKAILVSGHDLKDLEELLKQTEGTGINIYTHGEMLPAHGYPGLKKYAHLVGNYGGAWQDQQKEFDAFPGAILMTTNCIQKPADSYKSRIFTCGLVAWPDVVHISDRNFAPVIAAAQAAEGFAVDQDEKTILVGFGHNSVLGAADKVIELVQQGKIRHFFLVGGCDGAKSGRNYYTDLATAIPDDCLILTLACGKYRFNKLDFGTIEGLPRLLDIGQCNDAYSAIRIAVALAEAFKTDVNSLPLSLILSWYEQKAVAILLTLLHLGIKNIRLGPSLPAFVTPAVLQVLQDNFNLMAITTPEEDLKAILG